MLSVAVLLLSNQGVAQEPFQGDRSPDLEQGLISGVPDPADIIPLAAKLSGRLAALEKRIEDLSLSLPGFEKKYAAIEANLRGPADRLQRLKDSKDPRLRRHVELRQAIKRENEVFEEISRSLEEKTRQVGVWRKDWLEEKKRWNEWESSIIQEGTFDELESTFAKAKRTIARALDLVIPQLGAMLTIQEKAGDIQANMYMLVEEVDALVSDRRRSALINRSPPLLSGKYFSQFREELWQAVIGGAHEIEWPDSRFFTRNVWFILLQGFFSLYVIIKVLGNRQVLKESKRWQLLAARPFSAGLFLGVMATMGFYGYTGAPAMWQLSLTTIGGVSLARLVGVLHEPPEERQFVYGVIIVLIATRLLDLVSLPIPLSRLYLIITALVGLVFCFQWDRQSRRQDSGRRNKLFRAASLFLAVIIIAELLGKHGLALYLFISALFSTALVAAFLLFRYLVRGGVEWLFRASPLRSAAVQHDDAVSMVRHGTVFVDIVLWGLLFVPGMLRVWRVYDSLDEAMRGYFAFGFELGSQRITVGLVITSVGVLYAAFVMSWMFQRLVIDQVLARRNVELGIRHAVAKLVHYAVVFIGFLLALSVLGLEVTQLTIMLSALGVGIGFGLQSVANNFVSGIILLFERPVRVGDLIQTGEQWARIKRIGLRSTTVTTFEDSDLIVPNANLVNNEVTNWTLGNRRARFDVPVGVAYGSDVALVIETLMACAKDHPRVATRPEPHVLFQGFGESSLDFVLRAWVNDVDYRLTTRSELHLEIDRRFREGKIEIAFPQRDLHLRSLDESIDLRPAETPT
jgi:small-conductance mechanosensitive channel